MQFACKSMEKPCFGLDFRENAWKFAETHSTLESRLGFEAIFGSYARKGLYDRHVRGLQGGAPMRGAKIR